MLIDEKTTFLFTVEISLKENNILMLCLLTGSSARANDVNIVRSRDAQCNSYSEESPWAMVSLDIHLYM